MLWGITHRKFFENMVRLMRFSVYFERILKIKWPFHIEIIIILCCSQFRQLVSLLLCLFLSLSCSVFVLALNHIPDEGLLSYTCSSSMVSLWLLYILSVFLVSIVQFVKICLISCFDFLSMSVTLTLTTSMYFLLFGFPFVSLSNSNLCIMFSSNLFLLFIILFMKLILPYRRVNREGCSASCLYTMMAMTMTMTKFLFYIIIIRKELYNMNKLGNVIIY